jgi:hypothetical protein
MRLNAHDRAPLDASFQQGFSWNPVMSDGMGGQEYMNSPLFYLSKIPYMEIATKAIEEDLLNGIPQMEGVGLVFRVAMLMHFHIEETFAAMGIRVICRPMPNSLIMSIIPRGIITVTDYTNSTNYIFNECINLTFPIQESWVEVAPVVVHYLSSGSPFLTVKV